MQIRIQELHHRMEPELLLKCETLTPELKEFISGLTRQLPPKDPGAAPIIQAKSGTRIQLLSPRDILYFESVNTLVFAHMAKAQYSVSLTLSACAADYASCGFLRVNKSQVLNIHHLVSLSSQLNGSVDGTLGNGEHIIISRRYAKELRKQLKGE